MKRLAWLALGLALVGVGCPAPRHDASAVPAVTVSPESVATEPAAPASAPASGVREVGIDEVLKHVGTYAGQRIRVRGVATSYDMHVVVADGDISTSSVGRAACTRLACAPGNPCCNSCNGPVAIMAPGPNDIVHSRGINLVGAGLACSGSECSLSCNPAEGTKLDVTGELRVRGGAGGEEGVVELVVEKVEAG